MKIRLSELRRIVRQVIQEDKFEDVLPSYDASGRSSDEEVFSKQGTTIGGKQYVGGGTYSQYDRFHRTPLFKAKAESAFKDFPNPIYIIPVKVDDKSSRFFMPGRVTIMSAENGVKKLQEIGYGDRVDLDDLKNKLDQGGTVFLNAGFLVPGQLVTPWMMVHAMFDAVNPVLESEFGEISSFVYEEDPRITDVELGAIMTMASARNKELTPGSDNDPICELITQEITTRDGVRIKREVPENWTEKRKARVLAKAEQIEEFVKSLNIKEKFMRLVEGKVIVVATNTL